MSPRRNWDSPNPPKGWGGGAQSPAAKGVGIGEVPIHTTGKKLSTLPSLWL